MSRSGLGLDVRTEDLGFEVLGSRFFGCRVLVPFGVWAVGI